MTRYSKLILAVVLVGVTGFLGAKYSSDFFYGAPDLANGELKFVAYCAACHGPKGHGDSVLAQTMAVKPDNIYAEVSNPFGIKMELIGSVLDGDNGEGGVMPAFEGMLSANDVNDILGYIESANSL